jgi:hypothetical protein
VCWGEFGADLSQSMNAELLQSTGGSSEAQLFRPRLPSGSAYVVPSTCTPQLRECAECETTPAPACEVADPVLVPVVLAAIMAAVLLLILYGERLGGGPRRRRAAKPASSVSGAAK